jgi:oligopeptide transport system ATP-binding protein
VSELLEITDLCKSFPIRTEDGSAASLLAVDGVSLSVPTSGSVAIVGESGSGKTTVARMVAGLETPTSGSITINGVERSTAWAARRERQRRAREVQMVFQDPYSSLDPRQTVGNAIGEVLREHSDLNKIGRRERVTELLGEVGLDKRHSQLRPRSLSGGQRQRVAIARSLAARPSLLLLDEAVASLDVSVQAQVLNLLADLRERIDVAYLFISHDLGVVRQVADECIVMQRGRVVERGATSQILDHPEHEYTRRLIAALPRPGWKPKRRFIRAQAS